MAGSKGAKRTGVRGLSRVVERRLKAIEACHRRGESLKAYAERTGQSVYTLYEATRQARRAGVVVPAHRRSKRPPRKAPARDAAPRFVEAVVSSPAPGAWASRDGVAWRLRLPSGAVLESTVPLEASWLERLVAGRTDAS